MTTNKQADRTLKRLKRVYGKGSKKAQASVDTLAQGRKIVDAQPSLFERLPAKVILQKTADALVLAEAVDHPSHYGGDVPYEVIKVLLAWEIMFPHLTWDVLTAIKYIPRAGLKDTVKEIEDLEKAIWYLKNRVNKLYADRETASREDIL